MNRPVILVTFLSGLVFGVGLLLSGMTRPEVVLGFLDVAGEWNPKLAFVMMGAIPVFATAYALSRKWQKPQMAEKFHPPESVGVTKRLIVGSILFGAGWGIAGFCPGPALVSLGSASVSAFIFVVAMVAGQKLAGFIKT